MNNNFENKLSYPTYLKHLLPSVLTMIFLSFYTTIDGFFVSRYAGANALAGINIVIPITCIVFGVAVMLATGSGAIIGEKLGQKDLTSASEIFTFISIILLIFSIIFTIFGLFFLEDIAIMLGSSKALLPYVLPYAAIVFIGTIPMSFKLFFEYLVRTDGNSKVGLYMSTVGLVLNVILDYIFVGIMDMQTLGAALGTVLSITISCLIGLIYFLKYGHIKFHKPQFSWSILLKSCTNGSSEMLTEFSTGITTFLFNIICLRFFGENGVAAVTIVMYVYYFFISFYMGIAVASAPMISYNVGAKNINKISETLNYSFITILFSSLIITFLSYTGANFITSLFTNNLEVYEITVTALKLFSLVFIFIGWNVFLSGYFTALGNGLISAIISSLRSLLLVVAFILILPNIIGSAGIWLTMPFSEIITILISFILYQKYGTTKQLQASLLAISPSSK